MTREGEPKQRPVRVANCSGYCGDPPEEMYKQATLGDVDFITGDYLAEVNIANNAESYMAGKHPGYESSAWEGIRQSIEVISQKRIKVIVNGGALNPGGLAKRIDDLCKEKQLNLCVAYVSGDDLRSAIGPTIPTDGNALLPHLDGVNPSVKTAEEVKLKLESSQAPIPIVTANAYIGARGIVRALREGADIVICGRVSDASPVIGAAWYWHSWSDEDYDRLAGSLIAGHLIECSAYVTGANFAGFTDYDQELLVDPGFPIAEIDADGSCVITKHQGTGGFVNVDTVKCQLLYELQGNIYLHSDSKAVLDDIEITQIGSDRVRVTGVRGLPPPPTTKLAVFYNGGYTSEIVVNATGYGFIEKCNLFERQVRYHLTEEDMKNIDVLEFQRIGVPASDPTNQNSSTMYIRVVTVAQTEEAVKKVAQAWGQISLKHFSGYHMALDFRTVPPRPLLTYYPAIWKQTALKEQAHLLLPGGEKVFDAGHPPRFEELGARDNYDTVSPASFDDACKARLGDIALARSGDKGANLNIGISVNSPAKWEWLRSYFTRAKMQELVGEDWKPSFFIERVELPHIYAVHFVIYGILGRGVSSSTRLDGFGKGFADYIRDKVVDVPKEFLGASAATKL